jgi:hypothetical protein
MSVPSIQDGYAAREIDEPFSVDVPQFRIFGTSSKDREYGS